MGRKSALWLHDDDDGWGREGPYNQRRQERAVSERQDGALQVIYVRSQWRCVSWGALCGMNSSRGRDMCTTQGKGRACSTKFCRQF